MQLDDTATILASADFFEVCDADQRRLLAFASERRSFVRGAVIYKSGDTPDGAHVLLSGTVAAVPDGAAKPFIVKEPGALIGATSLVLAKPRLVTIKAVTGVETLLVPRAAFLKLAHQSPDLAARAAERLREDLAHYLDSIVSVAGRISKP